MDARNGWVHITECTFLNNTAGASGAAIFSNRSTHLRVEHSSFLGNAASGTAAIGAAGQTSISHCVFSGNQGSSVIHGVGGFISGLRFSADGGLCYSLGEGRSGVFDTRSGQFSPIKDAIDAVFLKSGSSLLLGGAAM